MKQHNKRKCDEMDKHDEEDIKEEICDEAANGNFIIHKKEDYICCKRITNSVSGYTSSISGEKYKIDGSYTCETSNCIYLVTCGICDAQYIGKTTMSMKIRHQCHRGKLKEMKMDWELIFPNMLKKWK